MAWLGAAVDRIAWQPERSWRGRWRLATAAIACVLVLGGGTAVWALRGSWRQASAGDPPPGGSTPLVTAAIAPPASPSAEVTVVSVSRPKPIARHHAPQTAVKLPASREDAPPPASAAASTDDTLPLELALIDAARADVDAAPARALAALARHRQAFPRGQLAAEREFLAVEALRRLDRLDEARRRAADLRRTYPSSSYAARATRLLSPTTRP